MELYNLASVTKKIYDSNISLFTLKTIKDVLEVEKASTLFSLANRLVKSKVLVKIGKNKYILQSAKINDFTLANFIYSPSYVSFESALNFYGFLSQFPYEITSGTSKKTKTKIIDGKIFSYTHIKKELFWGYEKKEDFLIALPEKAVLDQLYLAGKGLKRVSLDEYDLSSLDLERLGSYLAQYPQTRQFARMIKNLRRYIKR